MLRAWFSPLQGGDSWPSWLRGLLQVDSDRMEVLRKRWIDLQKARGPNDEPRPILRSLVHMHCNRIVRCRPRRRREGARHAAAAAGKPAQGATAVQLALPQIGHQASTSPPQSFT